MTERASEIIDMLTVLKENSYSGNPQVARDFTIIKDCKRELRLCDRSGYSLYNREARE